ncbi:ion transporter [Pseudodesulfovibrio sp. zrk46]|uniref:ion transporter n=1 Tax=Pseudodesulfovibrio sp. zrk46 TaxID=2725288 RepID=UPI001449D564|nr:ion transporter [Pseudodesulfovibrio sp. zrk46]QJB55161.1 ion transporter [Pseudodesulfovibrio sp. zrk46]
METSLKHTLYLLLEDQEGRDPRARWVRAFLVVLILLNVLAVIVETMEDVSQTYRHLFRSFEYFSVAIFTVEYAARLWVCSQCQSNGGGLGGRIRHALSPLMIVDLLAIIPFYIPFLLPVDLIFLRAIRLMRLLRVLKLGRYSDAVQVFFTVVRLKKEQLAVAGFGLAILLIIASSLMYYFEHEAQPAIFGSIPHAMWWAIITLTTVGYGDAYPVTGMGRFLASVIALLGIGMFALPAGILSAGFVEYGHMKEKEDEPSDSCPGDD